MAAPPRFDIASGHAPPLKRLTPAAQTSAAVWLAGPADPGRISEDLWSTLSSDERNRANRFLHARDRSLFAMTHAALRALLSEATSVPADEILFAEGPYGKPSLAGMRGPHFNISHSGSYALIGLSRGRPIGVDIEAMRGTGDELKLAQSFFSDAEYHALQCLRDGLLLQAFYKIWTCKEAILKALGAGISEHLKDFSVGLTSGGYVIHSESNYFSQTLASPVAAYPVEVPEGYAGCYALV
jgi:4'-phosphopantetheinyl transferase